MTTPHLTLPFLRQQPSLATGVGTDPDWTNFTVPHSSGQYKSSPQIFLSGLVRKALLPLGHRVTWLWIVFSDVWRKLGNRREWGQLREMWRRGTESPDGMPVYGSYQLPWGILRALDCQLFLASMSDPNIFLINCSFLLTLVQIGVLLFVIEKFLMTTHYLTSQSKFSPHIILLKIPYAFPSEHLSELISMYSFVCLFV